MKYTYDIYKVLLISVFYFRILFPQMTHERIDSFLGSNVNIRGTFSHLSKECFLCCIPISIVHQNSCSSKCKLEISYILICSCFGVKINNRNRNLAKETFFWSMTKSATYFDVLTYLLGSRMKMFHIGSLLLAYLIHNTYGEHTEVSFNHSYPHPLICPHEQLDTTSSVVMAVSFIIIIIGGIVFNVTLLRTIWSNSGLHSIKNYFIVNLAVCDLLRLVGTLPFEPDILLHDGRFRHGPVLCGLKEMIFFISLPGNFSYTLSKMLFLLIRVFHIHPITNV